ncbi:cytochrome P460 family protein [Pseudomonadota bacterium]
MTVLFPVPKVRYSAKSASKFGFAILLSVLLTQIAFAAESTDGDVEMSKISGNIDSPRRHARLRHATELSRQEASRIYDLISSAIGRGYAHSANRIAIDYQTWKKFNLVPYFSSTHGNHYLNNYANKTARSYGLFEKAGIMPEGSIIAKDSFAVTNSSEILLGPLFIMQKMQKGFNPVTRDWKYIQIQPNGIILGETKGPGAKKVEYCIDCHSVMDHQDNLYFIPHQTRVK